MNIEEENALLTSEPDQQIAGIDEAMLLLKENKNSITSKEQSNQRVMR